ncbi:sulfurtransferase complex subunit TusC [Hahella sp. HN01]|uniref:sulfurtransferase complex subunit TusC n=1 Tax=unclassified Hahella TaxID=2624107 RepID=UPI001C1EB18C|nr:sulfurtransferase complex subunit TusC [Hahella sp. HN01]
MSETGKKRLLYLITRPPFGDAYGAEGLDAVLAAAVFDQDVEVIFLEEGVFQLSKNIDPAPIAMKNHAKGFKALPIYGVEKIFVSMEALDKFALSTDDLSMPVEALEIDAIKEKMATADHIFSF